MSTTMMAGRGELGRVWPESIKEGTKDGASTNPTSGVAPPASYNKLKVVGRLVR